MNPPDSGKNELRVSVPMAASNLKEDGYEEDINLWYIESQTSIYK